MTTDAQPAHDPTLNVGTLALNDCRTVCRALKLRGAELRKVAKKCKDLDRHNEATQLEREAQDIESRLGPKFDEQGTFNFGAGPNLKADKKEKGSWRGKGRGRGKGKQVPLDLAEEHRERLKRGGR